DTQTAKTNFNVKLQGEDSSVEVISRSVAKDSSRQTFKSKVEGKNKCFGRVECDAIMTGHASVTSTPEVVAKDINASLIHEASIGKIAGEQLIKLMTLGLDEHQAEDLIIQGFLNG
ncbi:MAG: SufD family Fe-S cluster assembly protein, partial [Clostridia bacterium]|nr:SufD family Fe-S cluster assembly protein [Clostridia bacterium]